MKVRKIVSPVLSCAALALCTGKVQADAWQQEPSYGIELGYNDNYTLQPEPEDRVNGTNRIQAVATVKATAGLAILRLKPATTVKIEGKITATGYSGDSDGILVPNSSTADPDDTRVEGAVLEDRLDGVIEAGFESRRERAVWRLDAAVSTDSLLQEISLDAAVDTENENGEFISSGDNDDGAAREDVTRTRLTITPSYLYRLSPISYFRGSLTASTATYDNTPNTSLKDFEEQRIEGYYSREFTPINSWNVDAEVRNYEADQAGQFDSAVLGLGVLHKYSETTDLGLRLAYSSTSFEYGDLEGTAGKPLVQVTGQKKTGRTVYTLRLGTDLYGSATGDVVRADELLFNAVYQYSELTTLTWRSKLFQNKSLREKIVEEGNLGLTTAEEEYNVSIDDANRRFLAFEPTVNWRFSRWWVMDAGYRYQREKRDSKKNAGESNYAFIGVTYSKPIGFQPEY